MEKKKTNSKQKNKKEINQYLKYSNLAFQMIAIIMVGVFGGIKLDNLVKKIEFPLFTFVLTIFGIVLATYYAIKDFIRK